MVFLDEVVDVFIWCDDGIYIDGIFGRGGYSWFILEWLGLGGRFVVFDKDLVVIIEVGIVEDVCFVIEYDSFVQMVLVLDVCGIEWVVGVLFDFGISLLQIDEGVCGFLFWMDGLFDMWMDIMCGIIVV